MQEFNEELNEEEAFVLLQPNDFMLFGDKNDIDVLLSTENNVSLISLLTNLKNNKKPIVFDYDILIKGDVNEIYNWADLEKIGMTIDMDKRCLYVNNDWKFKRKERKDKFTCVHYERANSTYELESVIPVRKTSKSWLDSLFNR